MTIKEAFQKLTMVCGAALKNPFFVQRNLHDAFADIAENIVDASGDKVTVTPITDSGTKIAEIKVNNTTSELYAPKISRDYSNTPHVIGKWIDGTTDIYEITYDDIAYTDISLASLSYSRAVEIIAVGYGSAGCRPIPYSYPNNAASWLCGVYISGTTLTWQVGNDFKTSFAKACVTIRYIQSSES